MAANSFDPEGVGVAVLLAGAGAVAGADAGVVGGVVRRSTVEIVIARPSLIFGRPAFVSPASAQWPDAQRQLPHLACR
jgi:hypothetical protein